ncbi:hypothetical protein NDU88_005423 [Pleurodeles waltl]|uniref:Ig-like domain-containing protein n=1 Tax=Pleurodeles waltl TaxID=8319 RepID=A0AAV7LPI7_PLEWA|nr:hypothetical protein NDU88_005423 [Pleurodeles waltl]
MRSGHLRSPPIGSGAVVRAPERTPRANIDCWSIRGPAGGEYDPQRGAQSWEWAGSTQQRPTPKSVSRVTCGPGRPTDTVSISEIGASKVWLCRADTLWAQSPQAPQNQWRI